MSIHLHREIEKLKYMILNLGALAEQSVQEAVQSLVRRDVGVAGRVIDQDSEIDGLEIEVEEECLKLLALYQPVATDLRFIVAVLKINSDLERIADKSVSIAKRARFLSDREPVDVPFDFSGMADRVQAMLRDALNALVNVDSELALRVRNNDEEVDEMLRRMNSLVKEEIVAHPERADSLMALLDVSRHLERIADHASNIAEDVIYMAEGEIVRHRPPDREPPNHPAADGPGGVGGLSEPDTVRGETAHWP